MNIARQIVIEKCKLIEIPSKVAAKILNVSVPTLSRWNAAGVFRSVRTGEGKLLMFRLSDVLFADKEAIRKEYELLKS